MNGGQVKLRPCKLQMNVNGAWRDVVGFDAGNDATSQAVMDAAGVLAGIANADARIVMADASQHARSPEVLMVWRWTTGVWETSTRNGREASHAAA